MRLEWSIGNLTQSVLLLHLNVAFCATHHERVSQHYEATWNFVSYALSLIPEVYTSGSVKAEKCFSLSKRIRADLTYFFV